MNFSEIFAQTARLSKFSPNGKYLACASQYRLIVRDVRSLEIQQLFSCLDVIQCLEWSPDSEFILCGLFQRNVTQVWSMEHPEWKCKIDEGSAGLSAVQWCPDSRHILTTAHFQLRITVWSLVNKYVSYIKYPKLCQKGVDFGNDGRYMALVERREFQDYISVFACDSWKLVKHFKTDTEDATGVLWSPNGQVLAVWESQLLYKVLIYSIDGRCLSSYSAYENALGVRHLTWSATSQFLCVASFDDKVRLLNNLTWQTIASFHHPSSICNDSVVIYKESEIGGRTDKKHLHNYSSSKYELVTGQVELKPRQPDINGLSPQFGISSTHFSNDCRYLFTKSDTFPNVLWIWDVPKLILSVVLVQVASINCVKWSPKESRLVLCTENNKLYMWSPSGCLSLLVPFPEKFNVSTVEWHPDGNAILLQDKDDKMCVCYANTISSESNSTVK